MYFPHLADASVALAAPTAPELTRRQFLKFTTLAGSGLTLGVLLPGCGSDAPGSGAVAGSSGSLAMPFVRIDPDNTVTVICKHVEVGQGVWTGLAAILAEELDAAWSQMRVESSPAKVPQYSNLALDPNGGLQGTGSSSSVADSWTQLRQAGAVARAMLVQAAASSWKVAAGEITVSDGVVSHESSGKKATFGDLSGGAAKLPVPVDVKLKEPAQFKLVGKRLPRLDSRAKSTGRQQFAIDVTLPGMMTAVVMRPPRFGAKVASFDASKAMAVPGVVDVAQIPRGVAVVGRDMWSATKGRKALQVTWDESAAEKRGTVELVKEFKRLARGNDAVSAAKIGDVDSALRYAAKVIEAEFEFPYLAHAPMEPLTAVCKLSSDKCEIWAGSQLPTTDQANAAAAVGLKPEEVFIHTVAAGGAFGRRATGDSDYIAEVASIAKATGGRYPIRLVWTREDDITGGRYRPLVLHRVTAGIDRKGRLIAYRQRVVGQSINAKTPFASDIRDGLDPEAIEGHAAEQYDIPNADVFWTQPRVGVPVLWWRSVGHTHMAFSKEVIIDELAEAAGQDPVVFRLALVQGHPRQVAALKLVAEKSGWHERVPKERGRGRGVAVHEAYGTVVAQVADVSVSAAGLAVDRVVCAVACGTVVTPDVVVAQMEGAIGFGLAAALHGRITLTGGHVDQTNFHQCQVLRINEMPKVVEVYMVPSTEPPTGVGEPGVPPIAPAVANAIRAATGQHIRKLPFQLQKT
jgi:isoquinoline 1-oxidoreductase beta subunit